MVFTFDSEAGSHLGSQSHQRHGRTYGRAEHLTRASEEIASETRKAEGGVRAFFAVLAAIPRRLGPFVLELPY